MKELPPGLRFYPTEEELVSFYIPAKIEGKKQNLDLVIPVLHIYDFQPWDLPKYAGDLCRKDPEQWFFFIPIQEKEARGGRPNRLTEIGYWKATGSPGYVYSSDNRIIGEKKTMVFYEGRAPNGKKTNWKMNEYKAIEGEFSSSSETPKLRQEFSLCRVYKSSKCLRAYDRRPPATLPVSETAYNQALEDDFEKAMPRKGKFSESSPVAENFLERTHADNHCSSAATKNMDSVLNENNIWEWDQVNYGTFWGTYGEMFLVQ